MRLGKLLLAALAAITVVAAVGILGASSAGAQDAEDDLALEAGRAEPAAPEVTQAWAASDEVAAEAADTGAAESDAFAHIHDADAELLVLEQAERMVGFDLLDGVR